MMHTEAEIKQWWSGLAESRRQEILQAMVERAPSEGFCEFAQSLRRQWDEQQSLTPIQLERIKRWDR